MGNTHIYQCVNKRCKRYNKDQNFGFGPDDYKSAYGVVPKCKCGHALRYVGFQAGLFDKNEKPGQVTAPNAEVKKGLDAVGYELVNAVFSVRSSKHSSQGQEEIVTAIQPVRIYNGMSRGYALQQVRKEVAEYYKTSQIVFLHWADRWVAGGNYVEVR